MENNAIGFKEKSAIIILLISLPYIQTKQMTLSFINCNKFLIVFMNCLIFMKCIDPAETILVSDSTERNAFKIFLSCLR